LAVIATKSQAAALGVIRAPKSTHLNPASRAPIFIHKVRSAVLCAERLCRQWSYARIFEERAQAKEQMMTCVRESSQRGRRVYVGNLSYGVQPNSALRCSPSVHARPLGGQGYDRVNTRATLLKSLALFFFTGESPHLNTIFFPSCFLVPSILMGHVWRCQRTDRFLLLEMEKCTVCICVYLYVHCLYFHVPDFAFLFRFGGSLPLLPSRTLMDEVGTTVAIAACTLYSRGGNSKEVGRSRTKGDGGRHV